MKYTLLVFLVLIGVASNASIIYGAETMTTLRNIPKLLLSIGMFPISSWYNAVRYGAFTYARMAGDTIDEQPAGKADVVIDEGGMIHAINDGKRVPLVLGSIPRTPEHIAQLKAAFNLQAHDVLAILSFNKSFERSWAGLTALVKNDSTITLFKYPTIDYTVPSFIDLLRVVRDLKNRDESNAHLFYVHCKAGRGRSAIAVAAYLIMIMHDEGKDTTVENIQAYMRARRPQIGIKKGKELLARFQTELKQAGTFEILYKQYETDVLEQDVRVQDL